MAKRPVPLYDFAAFGQAIKAARTARKESRKDVSDAMNISPRYLTNIENKGQQPSLQIFYELVTRYNISVDQFFFPNKDAEKSTQRRQLDTLLDSISDKGLSHEAVAKALQTAGIKKLPNITLLQAEYEQLQAQKETLYADYRKLKKQVKEYDVIKRNIDSILRQDKEPEYNKETTRE